MAEEIVSGGDVAHMRRALELAERGWGRVSPNPLVGAVLVQDGRVVGEGWHAEYGQPHAEVEAIRRAGELASGATLYVTLEPCAHHGATPPCTAAILAAGIRRVVYAVEDPNPIAEGGGAILRSAGIEVRSSVEEAAARSLNASFFRAHETRSPGRPWTELKLALSLDGRIADRSGRSVWITGEDARSEVHRLRAGVDAISVGIGTALTDDPTLTVRGTIVPRVAPTRIVFDRQLRLPLGGRLAQSAREVPVWVVAAPDPPPSARDRLEAAGVRVLAAADLASGLEALRQAGIRSLFVEGGATLASALLDADLADRLHFFYAPLFLGAAGVDPFRGLGSPALDEAKRWTPIRSRTFGPDTLVSLER
jgi:diaminohydroxyphosphoribosylaminopyrimidine deaminase / 5-amino-6-(5-phosphoribosylamino)uracil reductase